MFVLESFLSIELPDGLPETPIGTGSAAERIARLAGGGYFDEQGSAEAALSLPYDLLYRAKAVGNNELDLADTIRRLKAKHRKVGTLVRRLEDGTRQACWARLKTIEGTRQVTNILTQPLELTFQVLSGWYSELVTTAATLDSSPKTISVMNAGDVAVTNAVITVSVPAGGTAITALTVAIASVSSFTYTHTISAGSALVIDCGAKTVRLDGDDSYYLTLDEAHTINDWLRLEPGANALSVTLTGGGTTSSFSIAFNPGES